MKPTDLIARFKFACQIKTGRLMDAEGNELWFFHWKQHRSDGPAFISPGGTKKWYRYGELHRDGGAAIEWSDGGREYYKNGLRHREDGPAIIRISGENEWWRDGKAWEEGRPATAKIEAERKERDLNEAVEAATVVQNNGIKPLKTVRFKKTGPQG